MPDDITPHAAHEPALSARAIQALSSTQGWARFAGVAMLGAALLKMIQTGLFLGHFRNNPQMQQLTDAAQNAAIGGAIVAGVVTTTIYAVIGWLALRYAERLNYVKPPRRPDSQDIVQALGAQHRYWRFQGVLLVVTLALLVLVFLIMIVGIFAAAALHH